MTGLIENVENSLKYGFSTSASHILRWIGLTIVLIIPILFFLGFGVLLKVYRDQDPNFENGARCFCQGFLVFIIALIYSIIPIVFSFLLLPLGIVGMIIALIISIFFGLIAIPAIINYARKETFGAAFRFGEIFSMIRSVTWGRFILAILVYLVVYIIISIIFWVIALLPIVGMPVSMVLCVIVTVPLALYSLRYWHNIFS